MPVAALGGFGGGGDGRGCGNNTAVLVSSFTMGCYLLACVTIVKANLPIKYDRLFSKAAGGPDFNCVGNNRRSNARLTNNAIFLASVCVSAIALAGFFGIRRANSNRYCIECSQLSCSLTSALQLLA